MVLIASFKSFITQHDVHSVNYGPISSQADDKTGSDLGRGYLVIYNTYKKGVSSIGF